MFGIDHYFSFIAAILIFQAVPGPGTFTILAITARYGTKAGFSAMAGILLGDFTYMFASVVGVAALMKANPGVFQAVQWFGAAYLIWLGMQMLLSKLSDSTASAIEATSAWRHFRRAYAVCLTNPKVVLFFVSFFPLFVRVDASRLTLVLMMVHVTFFSLLYQLLLVLVGNKVALALRGIPAARKIATRSAGVALLGFGIKLLVG